MAGITGIGLLTASGVGMARDAESISRMINETVPLYKNVGNIAGEFRVVRTFFSFSCSFSARYHKTLFRWGMSLPKEIKFLPTPVFGNNDDASVPGALVFYGVWIASPTRLGAFMEACYENVTAGGLDPMKATSYLLCAEQAGVNMERLRVAIESGAAQKRAEEAVFAGGRYGLQRTPSIGIGGRFLVTPDGVAGKEELLVDLLNALTSKMLLGIE